MLQNTVTRQRDFFSAGNTLDIAWRLEHLARLKASVKKYEKDILVALKNDLNKPALEAYASEIGVVYNEIGSYLKNLRQWAKPRPVPTPSMLGSGRSLIMPEPYGVTLIISPWNYPFLLSLLPLVGAVAAGNCVVLKPSQQTPQSFSLLNKIIAETFEPNHVAAGEDNAQKQELLKEKFDFIFFTGSPRTGKLIMQEAAKTLTPLLLELGGKNPVIVHRDAKLDEAARKIAWAKFINCGQTCTAPDYCLVHQSIKEHFINSLKKYITKFFGADCAKSPDYCRIVSKTHFDRVTGLMRSGKIVYGGATDEKSLYISPTLIEGIFSLDSPIMQEEIFGPLLPVLTFDDIRQAATTVNSLPKPLASYFFTTNRVVKDYLLTRISSGGACVNDVMLQSASLNLPFGGVGESGMGRYHGKATFEAFSNLKSVFVCPAGSDMKFRYPPYKKITYFFMKLFWK